MKRNKLFWGLLIFCAINFAAHLCFYGSLPDVVPTHWGKTVLIRTLIVDTKFP